MLWKISAPTHLVHHLFVAKESFLLVERFTRGYNTGTEVRRNPLCIEELSYLEEVFSIQLLRHIRSHQDAAHRPSNIAKRYSQGALFANLGGEFGFVMEGLKTSSKQMDEAAASSSSSKDSKAESNA